MLRLITAIVALVLSASTIAAQQPGAPTSERRREGMSGGDRMSMMRMDSLNHRLDSLVDRMNRTSGNPKVQAMAVVINELVSQRKAMQGRMHQMKERGGMMGPMMTQGPGSAWGDFNGDGHVDVVVTAAPETDEMFLMEMNMSVVDYPAPQLYLGNGDGTFAHSTMSGLEGAMGASAASAGDFDGDGDLDLFIARYGNGGMAMEDAMMRITFMDGHPLSSFIFRNDGHGMFEDATAAVGRNAVTAARCALVCRVDAARHAARSAAA